MAVEVGPAHWPVADRAARAVIKECTINGRVSHAAVLAAIALLIVVAGAVLKETTPRVLAALNDLIRQAKIRSDTVKGDEVDKEDRGA